MLFHRDFLFAFPDTGLKVEIRLKVEDLLVGLLSIWIFSLGHSPSSVGCSEFYSFVCVSPIVFLPHSFPGAICTTL